MYKVKPFVGYDLRDIKLPDTMYRISSIYGESPSTTVQCAKQTAGDRVEQSNELQSLVEQTSALNISGLPVEPIEFILQLASTSTLIDYLIYLKSDLKDQLNIRIYKHSSLADDDRSLKQLFALNSSSTSHRAPFNIQIILKPSEFDQPSLSMSDWNSKVNGELLMLAGLSGIIKTPLSNGFENLVQELLVLEYVGYLNESLVKKSVDSDRMKYYQTNITIKSKVLEVAEIIYKRQMSN